MDQFIKWDFDLEALLELNPPMNSQTRNASTTRLISDTNKMERQWQEIKVGQGQVNSTS